MPQNHFFSSDKTLPAGCLPDDVERTYDRSFKAFAKAWKL
jgi:hypothetical protein